MSTFRNPVGPQPSSVYWRRRLVVGLGLLAVILIVVLIIVRPGAEDLPTTTPVSTNASTDAPPQTETPACASGDITVTPVTDADSYDAGVNPQLSLTISNTGSVACTMAVGTDVQEYVITSGDDRIWSSKDCQQDPVAVEVVLEPGTTVPSEPFAWERIRSSAGACDGERTAAVGGGATYHLSVIVNGIESEGTKRFLLF